MTDTIIGGVIAGAVGIIINFWLERRREKAQKLAMVDALITETTENMLVGEDPMKQKKWWFTPYKLEAYHAYKGQLFFLPRDMQARLAAAVFFMEGENIAIQVHLSRMSCGQSVVDPMSMPSPEQLIKDLRLVDRQLREWREKHTGFFGMFRR